MSPSGPRMLWRGVRRRCPRCGGKNLFTGYFRMVEACPTCGHRFEGRPEEGFFLGAFTINLAVTEGALLLALFVFIAVRAAGGEGIPVVPFLVGTGILAVALPIAFYPVARTIWAACDLALRSLDDRRR